jgi:hypothetical protein
MLLVGRAHSRYARFVADFPWRPRSCMTDRSGCHDLAGGQPWLPLFWQQSEPLSLGEAAWCDDLEVAAV